MKIKITPSSFGVSSNEPLNMLNENFSNIEFNKFKRKLTLEELINFAQDADGIIAGTEMYNKKVLENLRNLKVISRLGVGLDNIDLDEANNKNIKIYKSQTTPAPAVAELTLSLMLNIARKISNQNQNIKTGIWKKEMGMLLRNKTLGIIGLGEIGKNFVKLISGFEFDLIAFDENRDENFAKNHKITYCSLNEIISRSDIITVHLSLNKKTNRLISKNYLQKTKEGLIIINTSRGEIIDEDALYTLLKSKHIYGAGLDVFCDEPYYGPIKDLDNVVLTPHIAAYAKEIRIQMEIESVQNLIKGINEKR